MTNRFMAVLILVLALACGGPREIRVEKNGVVVSRTELGPKLVSDGVLFRVNPPPGTYSLTVAGTFNQWDPTASPLTNNPARGVWMGFVRLARRGKIRFKYIRNGHEWFTDPGLDTEDDGYGSKNSVFDTGVKGK